MARRSLRGLWGKWIVSGTGNPRVFYSLPVPLPAHTRTLVGGYGLPAKTRAGTGGLGGYAYPCG